MRPALLLLTLLALLPRLTADDSARRFLKQPDSWFATKEAKKVTLSDKCAVELKELPNGHLEVQIHSLQAGSDPKPVASKTMSLKNLQSGELIAYGGNSKDRWGDAWLVIVRAEQPKASK